MNDVIALIILCLVIAISAFAVDRWQKARRRTCRHCGKATDPEEIAYLGGNCSDCEAEFMEPLNIEHPPENCGFLQRVKRIARDAEDLRDAYRQSMAVPDHLVKPAHVSRFIDGDWLYISGCMAGEKRLAQKLLNRISRGRVINESPEEIIKDVVADCRDVTKIKGTNDGHRA